MHKLDMLSYVLKKFFNKIGFNNSIEGSNIAIESMKIYFNLACLLKFTPKRPRVGGGGGNIKIV
jgi:hypothetical protein